MSHPAHYPQIGADAAATATPARSTNDYATRTARAIVNAYDFSDAGCVVDVGGGNGQLMSALLQANPHLHGVIQDRTPMIALAVRELINAGVTQRCALVANDFFVAVPSGGDVYILKQILCDWNDAASISILRRCRSAMPPHGKLLIAERVFNARDVVQPTPGAAVASATFTSKNWRDKRDYYALLNEAGFGAARLLTTASGLNLIEANR